MKTALGAEVRFFLSGFGLAGFIFVNFMYFMEFLLNPISLFARFEVINFDTEIGLMRVGLEGGTSRLDSV